MTPVAQRPDAVRNRGRILAAARTLVARDGAEVSMEAIAAAAGLAVGTLYRHFPTKEALLRAVVAEKIRVLLEEAAEATRRVAAGGDAFTELAALFLTLVHRQAEDRAVKSAVAQVTGPPAGEVAELERQATELLEGLMARARQDGTMRSDVEVMDVARLLQGLPGAEVDAATRTRCATVVLDGLRSRT